MRLGALVLQSRPWQELATDFRAVEDTGYDVAYVADHLTHQTVPGQWLGEPWPVLAAAAGVTRRVDLGTLVASSAFRSPVPLARLAATTHDVTGGRLVLGIGAGSVGCAAADRDERPSPGEMVERFADMVSGLDAVMSGQAAWSGRRLRFSGVETLPQPAGQRRPFLLVAAHGPRSFDLVGRFGDGWSSFGGPAAVGLAPEEFWQEVGRQSAGVSEACERHDRDPGTLRRSLLLGFGTVKPLVSVEEYVACAERAVMAGFDELVVYWPEGERGSRFWSDPDVHAEGVRRIRSQFATRGLG